MAIMSLAQNSLEVPCMIDFSVYLLFSMLHKCIFRNGFEKSCLFCAFSSVLDDINFDNEVDIPRVLDLLKPLQNSFISSKVGIVIVMLCTMHVKYM